MRGKYKTRSIKNIDFVEPTVTKCWSLARGGELEMVLRLVRQADWLILMVQFDAWPVPNLNRNANLMIMNNLIERDDLVVQVFFPGQVGPIKYAPQ